MIAYFARHIVGGVVTLFVAGLIMHTSVLYAPGGAKEQLDIAVTRPDGFGWEAVDLYGELYGLDKPWPVSYLAWLFDPSDTFVRTFDLKDDVYVPVTTTKGINLFGIQGSGVLTGDLGESATYDRGIPVTEMFGEGLGVTMLIIILMLPLSMTALALQRRRRPLVPGLPNYPQGRNLLYQYAPPLRVPGL